MERTGFNKHGLYILAAFVLGILLLITCFHLSVGDRNVVFPFTACFAPVNLLRNLNLGLLLISAPLLYPAYAVLLIVLKRRGMGLRGYCLLSAVHHICVAIQYSPNDADFIPAILQKDVDIFCVGVIAVLYFTIHLTAILYATRRGD